MYRHQKKHILSVRVKIISLACNPYSMHAKHTNKTGVIYMHWFYLFFSTIVDTAATDGGVYFSLKLQIKQTLLASGKMQDQVLISFYNLLIKPLV